MDIKTKLTTVKILKDIYSDFKKISFNNDMTLQKLVNRSIDIYLNDAEFVDKINSYNTLPISGSHF
jgi:methylaspartate ammonia-lyase